ncbi:bifunctional hydroxymethylpyrimidine kinase/phosphomethylpyrimidine kinase [Limimaricola litoreus]|uniref:hydroxymethylpyrimidine kinase n=1 Tax=Limimaricola litoreus TaxID=2955316 RepID=A0A9X2FQ13_9RHOB|nr:bifunctional hydroxymethylpyrimidine kinase/phosphomethylpyrimidine kinase [Limimaricola litoreus]MCP1169504.1 bifunctional hydroxymethylpyrimidine kinase/phosphomethylpyrimidine kinase [Limimaricola litoreus]
MRIKTVLTIAGSDSGGGAGVQADLKSFAAFGVYGTSAITALTAQNTRGVFGVMPVPPEMVRAQITTVLDDIPPDAIKIGMPGDAATVVAVAEALVGYAGPIVLDPVMVAKSGDALLDDAAVGALTTRLIPRAAILTPNLPEAARLLGTVQATTPAEIVEQGRALLDLGPRAVLMKGGHADGPCCTDRLVSRTGVHEVTGPRIATRNTHGTGCSLSAALAALLATGRTPEAALERAQNWLSGAIRAADALGIGSGHGPVDHFHEGRR